VRAKDLIKLDADGNVVSVNLDIKNPNAAEDLEHLPPEKLVEDIVAKEKRIIDIMGDIKTAVQKGSGL
jgi:type I restriction enzyme M protein